MGKRYLIDTNAVSDYLDNKLPAKASDIIDRQTTQLSVVTRIELLAWPDVPSHQLQILQNFITASIVYNLNEAIILETINIRKQYKIKLPDAIIAATALINNLTLLTRNLSDFKKITGLDVANPYLI